MDNIEKIKKDNEALKGQLDAHRMTPPKGSISAEKMYEILERIEKKLDILLLAPIVLND